MERCPRCFKVIELSWPYCPVCRRPRILESLKAPVEQPAWRQRALQGAVAFFSLWLVITVGVAFLREAKAVRDSRALLAEGKAREAWSLLQPFLPTDPDHRQALFLCGKATIRLSLRDEAKMCLQRVEELSPELAQELREDYGPILAEQTRMAGCNAEAFQGLLEWGDELGANLANHVMGGLDEVVEACHALRYREDLPQIYAVLEERGQALALVERGYVPAISRAVAQARYQDAESLARRAINQVPEGAVAVEAALKDERR